MSARTKEISSIMRTFKFWRAVLISSLDLSFKEMHSFPKFNLNVLLSVLPPMIDADVPMNRDSLKVVLYLGKSW